MSFRFIEDHRDTYPVWLMCAVLEVSPAGYYAWRDRPASQRAKSNATLLAAIRQVHQDSGGRYGSPRVHAVLRRQGPGASRGRIERTMRRHGIRAGFYEWLREPVCDRAKEDARLLNLIGDSYSASHGVYGARRVFGDLPEAGEGCGLHRVERLMRKHKIKAVRGYKAPGAIAGRRWLCGAGSRQVGRALGPGQSIRQ
jgi:transposase InsO family protein